MIAQAQEAGCCMFMSFRAWRKRWDDEASRPMPSRSRSSSRLPSTLVFGASAPCLGPARTLSDPRSRPRDRAQIVHGRRRFRGQPVRGRPADGQADPDELRPRRPALDRQLRGLSADQAGRGRRRQDPDPRRPRRRRQADKTTVFARGPADPDRHRARRRRRLRRQQHRALALQRHRRRRQGRLHARRPLGLRHRRHPPHPAHAALGLRRHALLQSVDLHSQPHRNAARRAPAGRRRHLAVPARDDGAGGLHPGAGEPVGPSFRPLGPVVRHRRGGRRGDQLLHPGRLLRHGPGRGADLDRAQSGQPQVLRARDRQRPAPARGVAREPA